MRCSQRTASRSWQVALCTALWTWWLWLERRWALICPSLTHTQRLFLCVSCWVFDAPLQIDLHIMTQPPSGEWVYFNTEVTNSSGRVSFVVPEDKRLGIGVYPVKMVVRWDFLCFLTFQPFSLDFNVILLKCCCHIQSTLTFPGLTVLQGWPHIRGQLPDCRSAGHRVCGVQHRRIFCCQRVDHGQWPQSASRSCGCRQVPGFTFLCHRGRMIGWPRSRVCFVPLFSPFQALAGFRLSDHLRDRTTGHAEAAGGGLVVTAQFPSRHRLVLRRPGPRPSETQGELPQVPNGGQITRER